MASVRITLYAQVKSLSENRLVDLQASQTYVVNQIEKTFATEDLHLRLDARSYGLEVRGKSGEPKLNRPVQLTLKHQDFRDPVVITLRTDDSGRIELGSLDEIAWISAKGPEGTEHNWPLRPIAIPIPSRSTVLPDNRSNCPMCLPHRRRAATCSHCWKSGTDPMWPTGFRP